MTHIKQSFSLGRHEVTLEYGEIGRQAAATVICTVDETVVMVAVTGRRDALPNATFLPLTVDYQEKFYAAGRIPGGFFRREGRPTEKETLTARLIDRSLRPLFPDFYYRETQVLATVLSYNPQMDADIPAMLGAAAAMTLSGIPFNGPIGAVRVGVVDGEVVVLPTADELARSDLDLVVAGTENGVLMVESEAKQLSEEKMLEAVMAGHRDIQMAIAAIKQMAGAIEKPEWAWEPPVLEEEIKTALHDAAKAKLEQAYDITDKQARTQALDEIRRSATQAVLTPQTTPLQENLISSTLKKIEAGIVRGRILSGAQRIDGRDTATVRPISIRTGLLPRVHGSALFTRGETQALVAATLGGDRDNQKIDALAGEQFDNFMLHYNFPPFATGETGRSVGPKRREIGHGRLAKRGLSAVMPSMDDFGFTVRVVSEITESNGSSSMASVCGGSLAMMDAGVPVAAAVSGIAMGLIKEGEQYAILSDILGDEDHLGDMDFKVAGSASGVTALQMDLKIDSISEEIMRAALAQAKDGRLHILNEMNAVLSAPRQDISPYAPRRVTMKIPVDKIRDVIGKGGSVIRNLTDTTQTKIDINDDGSVVIMGKSLESCERAQKQIENITADVEVGVVYDGTVEKILENVGAIINLLPGRDGLLHISQISRERIERVSDHLSEGQEVRVKVIKSEEGRVRLTMRDVE